MLKDGYIAMGEMYEPVNALHKEYDVILNGSGGQRHQSFHVSLVNQNGLDDEP